MSAYTDLTAQGAATRPASVLTGISLATATGNSARGCLRCIKDAGQDLSIREDEF